MKIRCLHGYFIFEELRPGEITKFINLTKLPITADKNHFTFEALKDAPGYAIQGGTYLGAPATKTFEGEPWEVMRANGLVYDFVKDEVVPILTVVKPIKLTFGNRYFLSNGMILAGSLTDEGNRVTDYSAHYIFESAKFKFTEVSFE